MMGLPVPTHTDSHSLHLPFLGPVYPAPLALSAASSPQLPLSENCPPLREATLPGSGVPLPRSSHWLMGVARRRLTALLRGWFTAPRLFLAGLFPLVGFTPSLAGFPEVHTFINHFTRRLRCCFQGTQPKALEDSSL